MKWYLIKTKPGEEGRVENNLKTVNMVCYAPKIRKRIPRLSDVKTVTEPLFPRYVFIKTSLEESYHRIKYTRGVAEIVSFGDGPIMVNEKIIKSIKSREVGGYIHIDSKRGNLKRLQSKRRKKRNNKIHFAEIFQRHTPVSERVYALLSNIIHDGEKIF